MIYKTCAADSESENSLWLAQVTDEALLKELKKITKWEKVRGKILTTSC